MASARPDPGRTLRRVEDRGAGDELARASEASHPHFGSALQHAAAVRASRGSSEETRLMSTMRHRRGASPKPLLTLVMLSTRIRYRRAGRRFILPHAIVDFSTSPSPA